MTRREKLRMRLTDDQLWDFICNRALDCSVCPIIEICRLEPLTEEKFKAWLDEEAEDD